MCSTGIIINGGAKPNIIPEEASLDYYIRAPTNGEMKVLKAKIVGCFEAAARATGCQVKSSVCEDIVYHLCNSKCYIKQPIDVSII